MATLGGAAAGVDREERPTVYVDARAGDDAAAEGSVERPYRTLTGGLQALRSEHGARGILHVGLGRYDAAAGEVFPLELAAGIQIRGLGSELVAIDGGGAPVVCRLRVDASAAIVLDGLSIVNGGQALRIEHGAIEVGEVSECVVLSDVLLRAADVGLRLEPGLPADELFSGVLSMRMRGLRVRDCRLGVTLGGPAAWRFELDDCLFERCRVGLAVEALRHELVVRSTRFANCTEAGFRRIGAVGRDGGQPYRFEDCTFAGNDIGLELLKPTADAGLVVRRCQFLENARFGVMATGHESAADRISTFEDSLFRWNGVGLHLTSMNVALRRLRVTDNLGNGVFSSNFLAAPTTTLVESSLIAHNGASGFVGMADGRLLSVELVHNTIVDNGAVGVFNKTRHAGTSHFSLRGCIVAAQVQDLRGLGESSVRDSLIGDGSVRKNGVFQGDPGFVAHELRDYRLRADSVCVNRGQAGGGPKDLDGQARTGRPDLGAFERPQP